MTIKANITNAFFNFLRPEVFFNNIFVIICIRLIILVCVLRGIHLLFKFLANKISDKIENKKQTKQVHTIIATFRSVVDILVTCLFIMEILPKLGIDIRPILTAAGVLGVAVGFGSKQLIEDIISGIMLIMQGQILVGDIIEINGKTGIVERLNLRMVVLRDWDGKVYYIRNGMIDIVTNYTRDFAFAIISVGISYKENVDNIMKVITDVANNELKNGECGKYLLGNIEMWGIDNFGESSIDLKFRIKTTTMQQWRVKREFQRLIKNKFDELHIEIPFPQRTLHIEKDLV
ncbi:MAG: mechanosensitive ion channel family protein [Candidatus Gastranaerophilales bacterium]|nr:mechanosensitive ion channel family protein [Candidatus Gastranaerophilales bacterium]